jgi:hypothetical protein
MDNQAYLIRYFLDVTFCRLEKPVVKIAAHLQEVLEHLRLTAVPE